MFEKEIESEKKMCCITIKLVILHLFNVCYKLSEKSYTIECFWYTIYGFVDVLMHRTKPINSFIM